MWGGFGEAWVALSYIISGIAVWGGLGYWLDQVLSTSPALFVAGVVIGKAGSVYLIYVKTLPTKGQE